MYIIRTALANCRDKLWLTISEMFSGADVALTVTSYALGEPLPTWMVCLAGLQRLANQEPKAPLWLWRAAKSQGIGRKNLMPGVAVQGLYKAF